MTYDPADHTIDEVHEHLDAHPEDTDAVLAAEQARGEDARVTLVSSLEARKAKPDNGAGAEQESAEAEATEKFDDGVPHGEYPEDGTFGYADKSVAESDAEFVSGAE